MTISAILALATGLPVVATRHSAFPDQVVPGKTGYLCNENDYQDLATKILAYLNHPELWGGMSRQTRTHVLSWYDSKLLMAQQLKLYERLAPGVKKVAFVVPVFPVVSETYIINQVADLIDRGMEVEVYTFKRGSEENISERYFKYKMKELTVLLDPPKNILLRLLLAVPVFFKLLVLKPLAFKTIFNFKKFGANAYSLKLLYWVAGFSQCRADLIHCHFGTIANRFLIIKKALALKQPLLTSFYGLDVSHKPKVKGAHYYDELKKECQAYIVMSEDMKRRVAALGFDESKLERLPISEDIESLPYKERTLEEGRPLLISTVGRFVEKKGFDDLIKALAIVKEKLNRPIQCSIIGGGELEPELRALVKELKLEEVVKFEGFMKVQDVIQFLLKCDLYVQPSKTASNGDME